MGLGWRKVTTLCLKIDFNVLVFLETFKSVNLEIIQIFFLKYMKILKKYLERL